MRFGQALFCFDSIIPETRECGKPFPFPINLPLLLPNYVNSWFRHAEVLCWGVGKSEPGLINKAANDGSTIALQQCVKEFWKHFKAHESDGCLALLFLWKSIPLQVAGSWSRRGFDEGFIKVNWPSQSEHVKTNTLTLRDPNQFVDKTKRSPNKSA